MKIIKTPWKNELMELVAQSKKSIKITSPFIKENVCNELLLNKKNNIKFELITSFKLMSVYSGSLDLNGIENIIKNNGVVKNYHNLHAKIYLFDDEKAIISSSNLTNGGLLNNYEYGLFTTNSEVVSKVADDFNQISSNENTGKIKLTDIDVVRKIIAEIPSTESFKLPEFNIEFLEEKHDIIEIPKNIISSTLKGWKSEVFKCVESIPNQIFSLKEINQFESDLRIVYPNNQHITDKIRQQLQNLRDLGLIEFLGNGHYKKLWK